MWEEDVLLLGHHPLGRADRAGPAGARLRAGSLTYAPLWDRYQAWVDDVGDMGVVYLSAGYSAMGHLLNYWMGVERHGLRRRRLARRRCARWSTRSTTTTWS